MINTYFRNKIENIEFDLSSTCNAYCVSCSRYIVEDGALKLNPHVNFNQNVSVSSIEKLFSNTMVADDVSVPMVGSIGDPAANPDIVEIIQTIYKWRPNAKIVMHTNGGLRTPDIWNELGSIRSSTGKRLFVYFSIDGLADTNHLYRHGVIWDKLMENVEAFLSANGLAKWKYVIFKWNEHQIETARKLSQDMGFGSFTTIRDRAEGDERENYYNPVKDNIKKKEYARISNKEFRLKNKHEWHPLDTSECIDIQGIYVNSEEKIVPCCKWATGLQNSSNKAELEEFMYQDNKPNWNSLKHYSFDEIMRNPWWDKLAFSLSEPVHACTRCLVQCSKPLNV